MSAGLTPDNELFLTRAVATGVFPSREEALNQAVQALREKTQVSPAASTPKNRLTPEEWIRDLQQWSDRHPAVHTFVDTSRESIY
jgi:Arc/MetJ-type ribon-helix-helix transcriptional regulator